MLAWPGPVRYTLADETRKEAWSMGPLSAVWKGSISLSRSSPVPSPRDPSPSAILSLSLPASSLLPPSSPSSPCARMSRERLVRLASPRVPTVSETDQGTRSCPTDRIWPEIIVAALQSWDATFLSRIPPLHQPAPATDSASAQTKCLRYMSHPFLPTPDRPHSVCPSRQRHAAMISLDYGARSPDNESHRRVRE
ncbi:hypothetical protein CDD83_5320 [Cordyceps sp. RAO-2017]|nr:hypothetical protein CDD83_5320 [Cordyceps sp. RAO-2017]